MTNGKPSPEPIDPKLVRKLADILRETELSEIEVEQGGLKIRVARQMTATAVTYAAAPAPAPVAAAPATAAPVESAPTTASAPEAPKGEVVKSPMPGMVYHSPQPGSPAFIKVGDKVKAGQTLLIIEAMKTMNPIPSPRDGTVVQILAENGSPAEVGTPLVLFE